MTRYGRSKNQIWKKLKQFRNEKGITQEGIADQTGLMVEAIINIERGIVGPKFDNLERIVEILKVEIKKLFDFRTK